MRDEGLTIWVIYYGATNHPPDKWIVRAQTATAGRVLVHDVAAECDTLDEARSAVPGGLYRMDRMPGDDTTIVEIWL